MGKIVFGHSAHTKFTYGEMVVGIRARLGKYRDLTKWEHFVWSQGVDYEAFATVGRWRSKEEVMDHSAPVYYPMFHIDIDRGDPVDAYEDTMMILSLFDDYGIDPLRVDVAYSGSKGFHIGLCPSLIAHPIFENGGTARDFTTHFIGALTDGIATDPMVFSPYQIFRIPNSTHRKGERKQWWRSADFRDMSMSDVFDSPDSIIPYLPPVPGEPNQELRDLVVASRDYAKEMGERRLSQKVNGGTDSSKGIGKVLGRALLGVSESESWDTNHAGRNSAAFIIGCWVLEGPLRAEKVARALGFEPKAPLGSPEAAWELMMEWNKRNDPPYSESELRKPFRSAEQTIRRQK